jgi:hypothetical protein
VSRAVRALVVAVVLAGCAPKFPVEQRTTQGPVADDFWRMSVFLQNGRPATFEEQNFWLEKIDLQIRDYLRRNQDKASGPTIQTFRFLRQVEVGMDKEQVLILLGPPVTVTGDPGEMEKAARRYWPMIKGNATEAWLYQLGWTFYFAGQRLVDITQYQRPF